MCENSYKREFGLCKAGLSFGAEGLTTTQVLFHSAHMFLVFFHLFVHCTLPKWIEENLRVSTLDYPLRIRLILFVYQKWTTRVNITVRKKKSWPHLLQPNVLSLSLFMVSTLNVHFLCTNIVIIKINNKS